MFTPIDNVTLDHGVSVKLARETPAYVARLAQEEGMRLQAANAPEAKVQLRSLVYMAAVGVFGITTPHAGPSFEWPELPSGDPVKLDEAIQARIHIIEQMPPAMIGAITAEVLKRSGLTGEEGNASGVLSETSGDSAPTPHA